MTIEQLQALPDTELNALAAKLRGFKTFNFQGVKWLGITDAQGVTHGKHKLRDWTPATSRDQSGELLEWFVETQWKGLYSIRSGKLFRSVCLTAWTDGDDLNIEVNGTGAKAETIAFCAAMLAMEGESK